MPKKTGEDLAQAGKNTILYVVLVFGGLIACGVICALRS